MPRLSEYYFRTAILFLIVGISIGIHMSISQNHNVIGAHAHINLLGWVTSAIFGGYYALNPAKAAGRLPLIGVGGIASGADAYARIRAGASAVQLYSALVFEGPGLVVRIKRDLAQRLRADGFRSVAEAVGAE